MTKIKLLDELENAEHAVIDAKDEVDRIKEEIDELKEELAYARGDYQDARDLVKSIKARLKGIAS